jgi:secreted trypsin-like serine protease
MALAPVFSARPAWAIVTSDQPGSHIVAPGQTAFGLNLDGVVLIGRRLPNVNTIDRLRPLCTAALISDEHVLCAAHCFDEDRDGMVDPIFAAVSHVAAFELPEGLVMRSIDPTAIRLAANWPQQEADIAVAGLTEVAPASAPRYALDGRRDEVGRAAVLAGYGETGHGSTGAEPVFDLRPTKRAGLNRVEDIRDDLPGVEFLVADFDSGLAANNALALTGFDSDLGFGADEVGLAFGDSGGPLFLNGAIAGVTAFSARLPRADVNGVFDGSWGEGTFFTRVSNYRAFLHTATGGTAVFVPEPPATSLFWAAAALGWLKPRRLTGALPDSVQSTPTR